MEAQHIYIILDCLQILINTLSEMNLITASYEDMQSFLSFILPFLLGVSENLQTILSLWRSVKVCIFCFQCIR